MDVRSKCHGAPRRSGERLLCARGHKPFRRACKNARRACFSAPDGVSTQASSTDVDRGQPLEKDVPPRAFVREESIQGAPPFCEDGGYLVGVEELERAWRGVLDRASVLDTPLSEID